MSSSLEELLSGLNPEILGNPATEIGDVVYDSRQLEPGALFVALRGEATDGHRFLHAATQAGASALLVEELPSPVPEAVAIARVDDTRSALAEVADRFFGSPSTRMTLIGVTGTNGKTSTVRMIEAILKRAGISAGSIDTISARFGGEEEPSRLSPQPNDQSTTHTR